ncbi:BRO-N domain-containing protein [Bacillus toyonensis]
MLQGEEIWFVTKDVCEILEFTNPTMAMKRIDDDERAKLNLGRQGDTNCVNESGLYSLLMSSRKPQARAFKKWITSEVIPTIRKIGGYVQEDREEEFIHKYFPSLSEDTKKAMVLDLRAQKLEMKKTIEVQTLTN